MKKILTIIVSAVGYSATAVILGAFLAIVWPLALGCALILLVMDKLLINDTIIAGLAGIDIALWVWWLYFLLKLVVNE